MTGPEKYGPFFRAGAAAATALWLAGLAGLVFHHSATPAVFGRYSVAYALGLVVVLALTPAVFLAVRALLSPSLVTRPDGTTFVVSPLSKILVVALSSLLALGLAQLAVPRAFRDAYKHHLFLQTVPLPNPARGINSRGFRGGEPEMPKPPGVFRIVLLGGSTTFDPNLDYEKTYGRKLELLLGAALAPRRVDVQCAAVEGYNSGHSFIRYAADAIELDADVVLVMHAVNDLHVSSFPPPVFRRDYGHYLALEDDLLDKRFRDRTRILETIRFFTKHVAFSDFRESEHLPKDSVVPDSGPLARNLRSIIVLGRSRGQRVVLCTQPHRFRPDIPIADQLAGEASFGNVLKNRMRLPSFKWYAVYMAAFNDRVRALAAEEGLPLLDLQRDVPPTRAMFADNIHMAADGARLEAELATKFLLAEGLAR